MQHDRDLATREKQRQDGAGRSAADDTAGRALDVAHRLVSGLPFHRVALPFAVVLRTSVQDARQKELRPVVLRVTEDLIGRALLDDLAGIHEDDAVRGITGKTHLV